MKNVGIHVLDFNDNIIDFISQSDGALINAEMSMNVEEKTETFDFTIENTRAEKLRERNRIIAQDNNGTFREFVIIHITDNFDGTTEIECNASYLEDLKTAKPIKPGKFEAHTTTQALLKTLADTGWEVSDDTEYGGNRTTSWTSHTNPFDLIYMLCTTYNMVPSFYIELGAHTVEHRYVSITKPKNLFKGKEITKGKDLTGMTRTIDLSEVKTALFAVGPEKEDGSRIETVVVDDEAQEIFGLPNRYIWDVYEPESNDENMTLKRLTTLAKTELNKRNQAAISYEVSSIDIHKYYNDVTVHLRDIVRVKDRDFRPPLYIEAEVIGIKYNWLADESEFTFGNVIEYEETKLREFFTRKLDEITKKLNDNISNVNTIVSDVVAGELEYYERKIFKGSEPPENPQNDTLWYDTSNPDVAVLRRYWNGEWITQTADDVEKIGGLRREQVMYRDLNNSFINLTIQHSKLQNDVYDVLNNEYLVDDDLKSNLNQALSDVDSVYQNIKTNLDSMDEDTATIGKLVDTQTLFTVYREKLQTLYKYVTEAKISIDKRLKLLQSQYTDRKFNDAMDKIAETLPNGRWDSENQQLYADIPNRNEVENLKTTLQDYTDGQISNLNSVLGKEIDSKINTTKSEISASISSVERKIDGIEVGGRNLLRYSTQNYLRNDLVYSTGIVEEEGKRAIVYNNSNDIIYLDGREYLIEEGEIYTFSFYAKASEELKFMRGVYINGNNNGFIVDTTITTEWKRYSFTFTGKGNAPTRVHMYPAIKNADGTYKSFYITDWQLEKGTVATDVTPAPEDLQNEIVVKSQEISKAQADAAETRAQAYADSKITNEEQARIRQADANLELLQQQQQSLKNEMATYTDNLINEEERARMEADKAKEEALQAKINLAQTQANAYADDKITAEEERAIADAIAKRDEAKLYADQKAQEAQEVANQNVINKLEPITTRVTTNESNITELDTQISFMAKSEDVAQELNNVYGRLTPLETTVESNKATLDILPTQIESKVSKQDYILDKNEIVQRLDNADSQRRQLSNEITDKVTITKFESGMTEAKNYTDNIKEQATIYTDNKFNNLNVGGRNLLRYSTQKYLQIPNSYCTGIVEEEGKRALLFDSSNDILYLGDKEYLIEEGEIYTFSFYAKASEELKFMRGVYINSDNNYFNKGETITTNWKRYSFTFTGKGNAPVTIYMYPAIKNADGTYKSFYITDWQLEKGTVATDVTPAPEDVETLVKKTQQDAEKATKAYADAQDNLKETKIKTYADDIVNAEEHRAIQDAESKLETAKQDAQNKANVAQQAAEDYAVIKANDAETNAKNYTDAYKQSNDIAMTKLETSISQNGDKIALKVDEQKFNASRKTLSQVISEISATTKGINLSYDENGNIQSYTMDKNGIQLRGDKVDITVNKDFNVMASRVDDKVGKNEIINRLNLSSEGLDINMNNIGIRGGDSVDYIDIRNNSILSYGSFTRTWANETDTANLRLGIQGGTVKVQNRTTGYNLYLTEKGLSTMLAGAGDETAGTLEFHSTKYNDTSRGVRLHSTYGAVALESDYSRIILNANLTVNIESNYGIYFRPYRDNRTGNNEFAMYVKQNDSGAYTDGVLKYGNVSSDTSQYGSGIRFSKSSVNSTIYATNKDGDIGTGHFFGDKLYGDLTAKGSNGYILVDDALRITDKKGYNNGDVRYKDLQCLDVQANSIRVNTAKDFYIGVSTGELRVTNNLRYNSGDTGYKDIRFANWHAMSSEKFKYDIKEWNYSVLDAFRNDLRLYSYKLNSEKETNYARNHHGIIIEREIPIEWRHGDGFDGNEVMFWNTKAIQELIKKVDKLEEKLNEQSITS
ncbi:phage tail spike protein [Staphylococcus hominis]|uniref:phage tail spike protein n=1 Tax=Staphylococcus hominis TaxID=1290 RepID=UPI0034CDD626